MKLRLVSSQIYLCFRHSVCACAHACVRVGVYVCVVGDTRGRRMTLCVLIYHSLLYFLKKGSLIELGARLVASKPQ